MAFNFNENSTYSTISTPKDFPTGKNIGIAFLDTGISPMADFTQPKNRIVAFKDFINNRRNPYDDNGHGTHVTGIPCGNGNLSNKKYTGIAENSNIISLKILDKTGQGTSSHAISALVWIYDNARKYNIKVVNLSIGSNDHKVNQPLKNSVEALWNNGITVIAAASNPDGKRNFSPNPPLSQKIITVGAWEDADFFPKWQPNSTSKSPTLYAYGENMISLLSPNYNFSLPNRNRKNIHDKHYISMSGASMATPFISGVASALLENNPYLSPNEIKNTLLKMASENKGLIDTEYCYSNYRRFFY